MCPWIAEVHQKSVTQELSNVSLKTTDHRLTDRTILLEKRLKIFGIETFRERGRINEIAKHDRELPSLTLKLRSFRRVLRNGTTLGCFRSFSGPQPGATVVAELSVCQQFRAAGWTYVFEFCSAFKTKIRLRSVLLIALATMHRLILYSSTHVSRCARFETGKGFHFFDIVLGEETGFLLDRFASTNDFVRHVPDRHRQHRVGR